MMSPIEYRQQNEQLMIEFEDNVRSWLAKIDPDSGVSAKVPFFRDGVTCPDIWFNEDNDFRPLFLLKEVNIGTNNIDDFLKQYDGMTRFEFAEYDFEDIRVGTLPTWKKVAKLAKGLEQAHAGFEICDYNKFDFTFMPGGKRYEGSIKGYSADEHIFQTANACYNDIIGKIAVMNIKKVGAGSSTGSGLSCQTGHYLKHLNEFQGLLQKQIDLIDPTVIICLGREAGNLIRKKLYPSEKNILWIDGYHPRARVRIDLFYTQPIEKYAEYMRNSHQPVQVC